MAVAVGTMAALSPVMLAASAAVALGGWVVTRSAGIWVLIAIALLPMWAVASGEPSALALYSACLVALIAFKRLLGNQVGFPLGISKRKVLFNRLFRDRDVDERTDWVQRAEKPID